MAGVVGEVVVDEVVVDEVVVDEVVVDDVVVEEVVVDKLEAAVNQAAKGVVVKEENIGVREDEVVVVVVEMRQDEVVDVTEDKVVDEVVHEKALVDIREADGGTSFSYLQNMLPKVELIKNHAELVRQFEEAVTVGDLYVVRRLIEEDKVSVRGQTEALISACEGGHEAVVRYLLRRGARTNEMYTYFDKYTPLHAATYRNYPGIVRVLAEHGAYIDTTDENGGTCLTMAAAYGFLECVRVLLEVGANLHMTSPWNRNTALHLASYQGHLPCVKILVEKGARVDYRNHKGETSLMLACDAGCVEVIAYLLHVARANPHVRCDAGDTALHHVFRSLPSLSSLPFLRSSPHTSDTMSRMYHLLLEAGAHADVPNEWRSTPIDYLLRNPKIRYEFKLRLAHQVLPLSLQCLAAQTIAMYRVGVERLPGKLKAFIALHDDPPQP